MKFLLLTSLLGFLFFITSCKKNKKDNCEGIICDYASPILRLTMQDKTTGVDYFFAANPKYPYSALKISVTDTTGAGKFLATFIDSVSDKRSFVVNPLNFTLSYLLSLNGATPDTLRYKGEVTSAGCCGQIYTIKDVTLNSQSIYNDYDNKTSVLVIKK